jgi:hypothetical protein
MFDIPVRTALKKLKVSLVRVKRQPASFATDSRNFLVRITNILKIELPVFVGLIRKLLWFARDGVNFTACRANLLNNMFVNIAP